VVPKDFKPHSDLELSPTVAAAVQVSQEWGSQPNPPAAGPDGRVVYSYGAGVNFHIKWFFLKFGAGLDTIVKLNSP
jgi:hypothetical protein